MEEYKELIVKYLANSTSSTENKRLMEWVKYSEKNKEYFVNYCNTWHTVGLLNMETRYNSDAAFKKFIQEVHSTNGKIAKEIPFISNNKSKSKKLVYIFSGIAAVFVAVFAVTFIFNTNIEQITVANNENKVLELVLKDGSKIYLNKNASITYPQEFSDSRTVSISGTAYFDIAKDSAHPFIIDAGLANIQVLGTSFEIATNEDSTVVTVNTGRVRVFDYKTNSYIDLTHGEIGVRKKSIAAVSKRVSSDINYFSWKTGLLIFDNSKMSKVAKDIERHYGIDLQFSDSAIEECNLSAKMENLTIEEVMELLEMTFGLTIDKKGLVYIVSGKSC